MDAEPLAAASPLPVPDSDMTIDYGDEAIDAEMGDDATAMADSEAGAVEEAVMGDAEEGGESAVTGVAETDSAGMAIEDSSASVAEIEDMAETASLVPDPLITSPATTDAPSLAASNVGFASPPLVTISKDELQISALGHSAATASPTDAPSLVGAKSVTTIAGEDSTVTGPTSDSSDVTQTAAQLSRHNALASQHQRRSDGALSQDQMIENLGERRTRVTQTQSMSPEPLGSGQGEPAVQENEVTIKQVPNENEGQPDVVLVETKQHSTGGKPDEHASNGLQQISEVKVFRQGTEEGGVYRPEIDLSSLEIVAVPADEDEDDSGLREDQLGVRTVLLTFGEDTYSVFKRSSDENLSRDLPVLFEDAGKHSLYRDSVESFFEALRNLLPGLEDRDSEIFAYCPGLGLTLSEDNVYTHRVSLYDLDRLHVGCGLEGRLALHVDTQARFATGFNALVQHIMRTQTDDDGVVDHEEEVVLGITVVDDDGEQYQDGEFLPNPDAEDQDPVHVDEEEPQEWHDEEVEYVPEPGEEGVGEENVEEATGESGEVADGVEAGDFEDALADLDSDDSNAVVEGAQADSAISERPAGGVDDAEGENGARAGEGGEGQDLEADGVAPESTAPEDDSVASAAVHDAAQTSIDANQVSIVEAASHADSAAPPPEPRTPGDQSEMQLNLSYDTPRVNGSEAPSVPLDQVDAVVEAAADNATHNEAAAEGGVPGIEADETDLEATADVVIDYEETPAPVDAEGVTTAEANVPVDSASTQNGTSTPPKRARSDAKNGEADVTDEDLSGDLKRPRLSEDATPTATS